MSLVVYNVLNRKKELFKTLEPNKVKMYACGITVYSDAHIGHARQAIIYDVMRRYLEKIGYSVNYIRNYTDVDDKIINAANELGVNALDYANERIAVTDQILKDLGVKNATHEPKASENITEMITFIQGLIDKKNAYSTEAGDVYFAIDTFKDYGKLSNQKVEENLSGVRKDTNDGKESELDFALWKAAKPGEVAWDSPWGKGRPGWHIECSVMSTKYLGNTIDIHGGGKDLVFPHHENEIAQSEAYSGEKFANYWIHNGLIQVNGQKMSKSLKNGITIASLLEAYHPEVIRMALLQFNYRTDINIVEGMFEEVEQHLYNFYQVFKNIDELPNQITSDYLQETIKNNFDVAMDDDFNTGNAISHLFSYFNEINTLLRKGDERLKSIKEQIINTYEILGLLQDDPTHFINQINDKYLTKNKITEQYINNLINERKKAKSNQDYLKADQIRDELLVKNIILLDKKDKVEYQVKIK